MQQHLAVTPPSSRSFTRHPAGPACALLLCFGSLDARAEPFATRDQSPLLAGVGIPAPLPSRLLPGGEWRGAAAFNWGSTALVQAEGSEQLIVDAETREARLTIEHAVSDRIALQLQLPYRYTGAGTLDSFIDSWHDFFSLPEGARPDLPRDAIRVGYSRDGATLLDVRESVQGLADLSLALGYSLAATPATAAAAWLSVKLPSGDVDQLTGSEATDVSLVVAGDHRFGQRWSVFGQAAVTWLGDSDLFRGSRRSVAWSGLAGVGWRAWRGLELKLQADGRSAVVDRTALDFLSTAAVLTAGGAYRFQSGWELEIGVSEDIAVETAPDVVLVLALRKASAVR